MNTGQMMLVIGAFSMLSILALAFNRTMLGSMQLGLEMEATLNALSIGQSMIDEIMSKNYDQSTVSGNVVYKLSDMTAPGSLGAEGTEQMNWADTSYYDDTGKLVDFLSKKRFNDVDDYNNYTRKAYDPRLGYFTVTDTVKYCSEYVPDRDTTSQTFYKKIIVVVTHPNLPKKKDTDSTSAPLILKDIAIYRQYF